MAKRKKSKTPVTYFYIAIVIFLMIFALALIGTYAYKVGGSISNLNKDWGAFGSLLSGLFTFIASFAALATLIEVSRQNRKQGQIIEKQLEATTFDQYASHKKLFDEVLLGLEESTPDIYFYDKAGLYKSLFPKNSPIHIEYTLNSKVREQIRFVSHLIKLGGSTQISIELNNSAEAITELLELQKHLNIKGKGEVVCGDIIGGAYTKDDYNTKVNIYEICENIQSTLDIFNTILHFLGSEISFNISEARTKKLKTLCESIKYSHKTDTFYKAHKKNQILIKFEEVFLVIVDVRNKHASSSIEVYERSFKALYSIFSDKNKLDETFEKPDRVKLLYSMVSGELKTLEELDSQHSEKYRTNEIDSKLVEMMHVYSLCY